MLKGKSASQGRFGVLPPMNSSADAGAAPQAEAVLLLCDALAARDDRDLPSQSRLADYFRKQKPAW